MTSLKEFNGNADGHSCSSMEDIVLGSGTVPHTTDHLHETPSDHTIGSKRSLQSKENNDYNTKKHKNEPNADRMDKDQPKVLFPIREIDSSPDSLVPMDFEPSENRKPCMILVYEPGCPLPDLEKCVGRLIEVRIKAQFLSPLNAQLRNRQLWGTGIYTDDSDIVSLLVHSGKYFLKSSPPSNAGLSVLLRVLPSQQQYKASTQFRLRSRKWNSRYHRFSLSVEECRALSETTESNDLISAASPSIMQRIFVPDVTIMFNSSNEPCLKYCLGLIGDRGMDQEQWTSSRLRTEVLYFETGFMDRYELSLHKKASSAKKDPSYDTYRLSKVKPTAIKNGQDQFPLKTKLVEDLEKNLDWEDIEWGPESVRIRGNEYHIKTVLFRKRPKVE